MADSLYVCLFSNGHIKVGRSINAESRIGDHMERVACLGIELLEWHTAECVGPSGSREKTLIERCAAAASCRNKNEWFVGLEYATVCAWADEIAASSTERRETLWTHLIADIVSGGTTQAQIAAACRCSTSTLSRLAIGQQAEPLHSLGEKLIALHNESAPAHSSSGQSPPGG